MLTSCFVSSSKEVANEEPSISVPFAETFSPATEEEIKSSVDPEAYKDFYKQAKSIQTEIDLAETQPSID